MGQEPRRGHKQLSMGGDISMGGDRGLGGDRDLGGAGIYMGRSKKETKDMSM